MWELKRIFQPQWSPTFLNCCFPLTMKWILIKSENQWWTHIERSQSRMKAEFTILSPSICISSSAAINESLAKILQMLEYLETKAQQATLGHFSVGRCSEHISSNLQSEQLLVPNSSSYVWRSKKLRHFFPLTPNTTQGESTQVFTPGAGCFLNSML
jgi:hypothetical protein